MHYIVIVYLIKNKILNDEFYLNWELMIEPKKLGYVKILFHGRLGIQQN